MNPSNQPVQPGQFQSQSFQRQVTRTVGCNYLISLPQGYEQSNQRWPLLIFLHGAGERGDDVQRVALQGPFRLMKEGKQFPAIVVAPQCAKDEWWDVDVLMAMLAEISEKYRVDEDRIYLTGMSMGGYGTWMWASREPERFAAIVPICGGGNKLLAWKLTKIPIWAFHGVKDPTVPVQESQRMVDAVNAAGGKALLTLYPDVAHEAWAPAYQNQEMWDWMFQQHR